MSYPQSFSFACPCPTPWAPPAKKEEHKGCNCQCKSSCKDCCDVCLKEKCCDEAAVHLASALSLSLGTGSVVPLQTVAQSPDGIRVISPGIVQVEECGKYLVGLFVTVSVGVISPLELVLERCDGSIRVLHIVSTLLVVGLADTFSAILCLEPSDRLYLRNPSIATVQAGVSLSVAKLCCD
ncbi:hypothetical protein BAMA_17550 [Bacillus manliponensis]|uniref:Uncharacterized protein n=1 Tax=Bacillus manliponensis TaxID=574376 RepID=A0A073K173_9BACI|nr:hypothetical protein [Bacillus manliponensis]KEK20245.1 hypothetical protein BAMA_17550 [Bacillus manliponensis]